MTSLINLTPHVVTVLAHDDEPLATFPPAGPVARVQERVVPGPKLVIDSSSPVPCVFVGYEPRLLDLPDPTPGVLYLVSRVTAAATTRSDLVFPQGEVRKEGQVIGCRALGTFHALTRGADHA